MEPLVAVLDLPPALLELVVLLLEVVPEPAPLSFPLLLHPKAVDPDTAAVNAQTDRKHAKDLMADASTFREKGEVGVSAAPSREWLTIVMAESPHVSPPPPIALCRKSCSESLRRFLDFNHFLWSRM
jgi:hypothetical protein